MHRLASNIRRSSNSHPKWVPTNGPQTRLRSATLIVTLLCSISMAPSCSTVRSSVYDGKLVKDKRAQRSQQQFEDAGSGVAYYLPRRLVKLVASNRPDLVARQGAEKAFADATAEFEKADKAYPFDEPRG